MSDNNNNNARKSLSTQFNKKCKSCNTNTSVYRVGLVMTVTECNILDLCESCYFHFTSVWDIKGMRLTMYHDAAVYCPLDNPALQSFLDDSNPSISTQDGKIERLAERLYSQSLNDPECDVNNNAL